MASAIQHLNELRRRLKTPVVINMIWSMLGSVLPLLVALITVPYLIASLGLPRFGVLSIAWVVVGYFSLFDLGLGRAMTQLIAQKIGRSHHEEIPSIVISGMVLMTALGIVGGLVIAALSPWLVGTKLVIPAGLHSETLASFYLLATSIPIIIVATGLRGILEAHQRFDIVNMIRAPLGALTYLGPLAALYYSNALPAVVLMLVIGRGFSCTAFLLVCLNLYPEYVKKAVFQPKLLPQLLSFGGWMTLSNIAGPILLYLSRLSLALLVSVEVVAYFSTPYDVVTGLLLIPSIFVTVLFPIFAERFAHNGRLIPILYKKSMHYIFLIMLPITLVIFLLAKPALSFWINEAFSDNSYRVAQLLAIGVFINSFGYLSQALIQAYGRPDLTAKLHVAELVAYVPYMTWLIKNYGIEGAAIAWVVRVTISTIALGLLAKGCLKSAVKGDS